MQKGNEQVRSLLEMLAVIVFIVFLSMGSIWLYGWAMSANEANSLHDDIMLRGRLEQEGRPTKKKSFSTALENKTRLGQDIIETRDADGYYYSFTVESIKEDVCQKLLTKDYEGADRITINGIAYGRQKIRMMKSK